jgi:hypothetical protein
MHEGLQRMLQGTPSKTHNEHITPFLDAIIFSSRNPSNNNAPHSIITKYFWSVDEAIHQFTNIETAQDGWTVEKIKNGVGLLKKVEHQQDGRGGSASLKLSVDIELGVQVVHNYLRDVSDWKGWYSALEEGTSNNLILVFMITHDISFS